MQIFRNEKGFGEHFIFCSRTNEKCKQTGKSTCVNANAGERERMRERGAGAGGAKSRSAGQRSNISWPKWPQDMFHFRTGSNINMHSDCKCVCVSVCVPESMCLWLCVWIICISVLLYIKRNPKLYSAVGFLLQAAPPPFISYYPHPPPLSLSAIETWNVALGVEQTAQLGNRLKCDAETEQLKGWGKKELRLTGQAQTKADRERWTDRDGLSNGKPTNWPTVRPAWVLESN